jgi:hypothetical protein
MEASEAKRPKALEDENTRLKRLLADAILDNVALKDLLGNHVADVLRSLGLVGKRISLLEAARTCRIDGLAGVAFKTIPDRRGRDGESCGDDQLTLHSNIPPLPGNQNAYSKLQFF